MARKKYLLISFIVVIAVVHIHSQDDKEEYLWENPSLVTVKNSEMAFSEASYRYTKNEGVFFMSRFNGGWVLMLNLFWFDSPFFNRWGIYVLVSDPSGKSYWAIHEMRKRDITFKTDRLYVREGKNIIQGKGSTYYVKLDFKEFSCDLVFQNIVPPWKPGDGLYLLSQDRQAFQHRVICSPWALVKGSLKIEGATLEVKGQGYIEKSLSVNPLSKLHPLLYSVRVYSPEEVEPANRWHLGLLDLVTHADYGAKRIPRLVVIHGQDYLFTTQHYTIEAVDFIHSDNSSYRYPERLRIYSATQGYILDGEYFANFLFSVTDVLAEIPFWLRSILSLFLKRPIFFRCLGEFKGTLTMPDGSKEYLHLYGPYEYVVVK